MKKFLWCLLISLVLLGTTPLAFAGLSKGEWEIEIWKVYKTWQPNGDCVIGLTVGINDERRQREERHGYFPVWKVIWSRGGMRQSKMEYCGGNSITIPRAYEIKDWEVTIQTGWANERDVRDNRFSNESDGGRIYLTLGVITTTLDGAGCVTQFNNCTRQDIVRFFDMGETQAQLWDWSNNNPPKIMLKSSNVSGEWAAGTFTQTFEFGYEARTNPDNSKARTFEIELTYGKSICLGSEDFDLEIGTKTMRIVNTGVTQTIKLSVPQNEVSRFSHTNKGSTSPILINAFRWKVTEIIDGRDPIVRTFFIPVSSTLTIN